ncbi:MAG: ABC transporter permease [Bacteroidales bacterium]|nr:ABC transporter permease [Bacteroidales bacterium]
MILTTFKLAFRNLSKNRVQALISIFGLTIGFTAFILISLYLNYEYSWDKQNTNYDRIYRVQQRVNLSTGEEFWNQTQAALPKYLRENYPEVENSVLVREAWGEFLSSSKVQTFFESEGYYAEQNLFDIFSYNFIAGDKTTALTEPYSIILSDKLADKLFPNENALGQNVWLEKKYNLKVTGIFKVLPFNSSIRPSYIIPVELFEKTNNWKDFLNNWTATSFKTYVLLKENADKNVFENKITNLLDEYEALKQQHKLYLLPLKDVFLRPSKQNDYMVAIFLYGLIGIFILLLASINFVNLTTANSSTRAKEIGVKKINGSTRQALIGQFLGESVIISLLAVNFAFVAAKIFLPVFSQITNRELEFNYQDHIVFILVLLGISIMVGILSGLYPAFFLSSLKTVNVLKADFFKSQKGKVGLKKVLVTFQFFISVFLIISTLIVINQINYMMNKDRGFNIHNIVYAQFRSEKENGNIQEIRNRLLTQPDIKNVTISLTIPFRGSEGRSINWEGSGEDQINSRFNRVDEKFLETFEMELVLGRNFHTDYQGEIKECIINETALKIFGWTDPIGKKLWDNRYQVIGVVKDFHYENMHDKIEPYIFVAHSGNVYGENIYSIRVNSDNLLLTRRKITELFEEIFPDDAFEFWFLEDRLYDNFAYQVWDGVDKTFRFFTVLAILISMIGLFGLISYSAKRRTKEMGIRKVMGSSIGQVYLMFIREFIPLLVFAISLGSISAVYFYKFLPGSYKCPLQIREFVYASVLALFIAILTISYQSLQVALSNPVKSLRYE